MEEKIGRGVAASDGELLLLVRAAGRGSEAATLRILSLFEADIEQLSRFMRMPREEAKQTLVLELLEMIRSKAGEDARQPAGCAEKRSPYAGAIDDR